MNKTEMTHAVFEERQYVGLGIFHNAMRGEKLENMLLMKAYLSKNRILRFENHFACG